MRSHCGGSVDIEAFASLTVPFMPDSLRFPRIVDSSAKPYKIQADWAIISIA